MKRSLTLLTTVVLFSAAATSARAQQQQQQQQRWIYFDTLAGPDYLISIDGQQSQATKQSQQAPQQSGQRDQQQARQRQVQVKGTIQNARLVRFRGQDNPHIVAEMQLDSGRRVTVDFGPHPDLRGQAFRRGQEMTVSGRVGRINGGMALFAERFRTGGQTFAINRQQQQQQSGQAWQASDRQQQVQQQARPGDKGRPVRGRVMETRQAQLRGQQERHVLAIVRSEVGPTMVVDLGPVSALRDNNVRLQRNQPITFVGRYGRINGKPVLFVERLNAGDRAVRIDRSTMRRTGGQGSQQPQQQMRDAQPQQRQQASRSLTRTLRGTIADVRKIQLSGQQGQHVLVKLQPSSGRPIVVDLGPRQNLRNVNIAKGERVSIAATPGRINGKPIFVAQRLRADGKTMQVNWQATKDAKDAQQAQQAQQAASRQPSPSTQPGQ